MKYLKLYEDHAEKQEEKLYIKLNNDDKYDNVYEPFNLTEKSKLSKYKDIEYHTLFSSTLKEAILDCNCVIYVGDVYKNMIEIDIVKQRDEWFYVGVRYTISSLNYIEGGVNGEYKCDTIDGVIQLINDMSKKIKSHNESINNEDYYQEVSKHEYKIKKSSDDSISPFDKEEVTIMDNLINSYNKYRTKVAKIYLDFGVGYENHTFKLYTYTTQILNGIKLKDEWYYIEYINVVHGARNENSNYYKCDQFEGLLKLLQDKL